MVHRHENGSVAIMATLKYLVGLVLPLRLTSGRAYTPRERALLAADYKGRYRHLAGSAYLPR